HDVARGQRHLAPNLGVAPFVRIEQRKSAEVDGQDGDDDQEPESQKTQGARRLHYGPCFVDLRSFSSLFPWRHSPSIRTPSPRTCASSPTTRWKVASRAR